MESFSPVVLSKVLKRRESFSFIMGSMSPLIDREKEYSQLKESINSALSSITTSSDRKSKKNTESCHQIVKGSIGNIIGRGSLE